MSAMKKMMLIVYILPTINFAYNTAEKTQANQIMQLSKDDGKFHPKLTINGVDNKQGKRNVYQNEYGVVVLVTNQNLIKSLHKARLQSLVFQTFSKDAVKLRI